MATPSITINPYATSNAAGSFNTSATGYIQGNALPDPALRNELAGGILDAAQTIPMWGGVGITELVGGGTGQANSALGSRIGRASTLAAATTGQLTGFSVFDQDHAMVNSPSSPVPLSGSGGAVHFYRLGSGIRIPVNVAPSLVSLRGTLVTSLVSWDFAAQQLIPYSATYPQTTITGAVWASTAGGQTTLTVGTDLTAYINAGDIIEVSGVVNTGGASTSAFNGQWVVVSITSTTIVVTQAASVSPGTYASGGIVAAGGGALPVQVLDVQIGNSMTVVYDPVTGLATWNRAGNCAVILL